MNLIVVFMQLYPDNETAFRQMKQHICFRSSLFLTKGGKHYVFQI
jgi:hypothetical protein